MTKALKRLALVGVLAGLAVALAACAPPAAPPPTPAPPKPAPTVAPAKPAAKPVPEPTAKPVAEAAAKPAAKPEKPVEDMSAIFEAAKKEGRVAVYSSMNLQDAEGVFPLFEKRYPGVKVNHIRAGSEALIQRMVTEIKAGKVLADVLETNGLDWLQVLKDSLIAAWEPPEAKALSAGLKSKDNLWYTSRVNQIVIQCNTTNIKPEECHKLTVESLAEPRFKDQLLIEQGDVEWLVALAKRKYKSDEKAFEVMRAIAANNPAMHKGHTETSELLIAGKGTLFGTAYLHRVYVLADKKAPSDWARTEGVLQQQLVGVVKGGPHPNGAKLFTNWLLTEEGAQAIAAVGRVPGRQDVKLKHDFYPKETKWYPQEPEDASEMPRYQKVWNEIFGLR